MGNIKRLCLGEVADEVRSPVAKANDADAQRTSAILSAYLALNLAHQPVSRLRKIKSGVLSSSRRSRPSVRAHDPLDVFAMRGLISSFVHGAELQKGELVEIDAESRLPEEDGAWRIPVDQGRDHQHHRRKDGEQRSGANQVETALEK